MQFPLNVKNLILFSTLLCLSITIELTSAATKTYSIRPASSPSSSLPPRRISNTKQSNKELSPEEIDPNIDPNPLPSLSENTIANVASDNNLAGESSAIETEQILPDTNAEDNTDTEPIASTVASTTTTLAPVTQSPINHDDEAPIRRYCDCSNIQCSCCRDFSLPIVPIRGPGCASVKYLGNEKMSLSIKYGDVTLASRVISGKNAAPICVPLPGGYSSFCGRVYNLRQEQSNFKACLGLELRAEDEVEAALKVSCFKFGNNGLQVAEAEPLPKPQTQKDEDDYDFFGLDASDDDDDDSGETAAADDDYEGFSLFGADLLDGVFGGGES